MKSCHMLLDTLSISDTFHSPVHLPHNKIDPATNLLSSPVGTEVELVTEYLITSSIQLILVLRERISIYFSQRTGFECSDTGSEETVEG